MDGVKRDCFGYGKNGAKEFCRVLEELECAMGECAFYKKKGTLCDSCNPDRFADCRACKKARGTGNRALV